MSQFGWVFVFVLLLISSVNEKRWIQTQLAEEVKSGLLSAQQVVIASSPRKRNMAFLNAPAGKRAATRRFYTACVEIAFKKQQRLKMGEEGHHNTAIITNYRNEIRGYILKGLFS